MPIQFNYHAAMLRVCVDQTENKNFGGRIVSQRLSSPILFSDVHDFFAQVNALLDVQRFPQAFQSIRSFTDAEAMKVPAALTKEEMSDSREVDVARGQVATFLLQVTTRQNSSWQGYIDWLDNSPKQFFSSTLEFIKLVIQRIQ